VVDKVSKEASSCRVLLDSKQKWVENDLKLADTQRNNLTIPYVPDTLCIVMMHIGSLLI